MKAAAAEFTFACYSDRGRVKEVNQDSIALRYLQDEGSELLFAGLFDGMGGLNYGEKVSGAAARWMSEWVKSRGGWIRHCEAGRLCDELESVLCRISARLWEFGRSRSAEVGTTVVSLLFSAGMFLCCNAGDSRAYRLSGGSLHQLSEDHNLAFELAGAGVISAESARNDPRKNVLTRALGLSESVSPAFLLGDYAPGDLFLLCCDGFYHSLSEEEIRTALMRSGKESDEMENTLRELAECAMERMERDNISAVLIRVRDKEES